MSTAYDFVQQLAELVPIFTAAPGSDREFVRPMGWSTLTIGGNAQRLAAFAEGHAVMAHMGGPVAVIDVDTKNGADPEKVRQLLDGLGVRRFADVVTPSGGWHYYVAGHPDLPTVHAQEGRDGLAGYPGVEIIAHGANVFLPGTRRPKYDGGGYHVAVDNLAALADGGDPDGAEALAGWVAEHRASRAEKFTPAPPWNGTPPDAREAAYLAAVVRNTAERIAGMSRDSGRNTAVFNAAMCFGNYIAGAGLEEGPAVDALLDAARRCGLTADDGERSVLASIHSGLRNGRTRPRAVPAAPEASWVEELPPANVDTATGEILDTDDATQAAAMEAAAAFAREVSLETHRLKVREAAKERHAADKAGVVELPVLTRLDAFLAIPDEDVTHRVAGLWPTGGRVVLSAQHKAGKTTLSGNLLRSLADGEPFLGAFDVMPAARVVLVDNELDPRMLRRWLRDQGIENTATVELIPLRGRLSSFDILDPATRERWAKHIGSADVLLLDCLRPSLDALRLSEDKDAGRFLEALDELTVAAGISETLVVHHMGHSGERSRGDSRILDWPDAVWKLVKDAEDEDEESAQPRRYFTGYGRDVDQPEALLHFDPSTRHLSVAGGSRRDTRNAPAREAVLELLAGASEALSGRAIEDVLTNAGHPRDQVRAALKRLRAAGEVDVEQGPRRALLHTLNPSVRGSARECAGRTEIECASAPIGRTLAHSAVGAVGGEEEAAHSLDELPPPAHLRTPEPRPAPAAVGSSLEEIDEALGLADRDRCPHGYAPEQTFHDCAKEASA